MKNQNPCDVCKRKNCLRKDCTEWRNYYMERQALINGYAREHDIAPIYLEMTADPCATCSVRYYCDTICPARAKWWDVCMEKLRGRLVL